MTAWWKDEAWRLVIWDNTHFAKAPGDRPPQEAELAQGGAWADLYVGHRSVAHWARPYPLTKDPPRAKR